MFAVYVLVRAWGTWGEADRWFLLNRFESRADAERAAAPQKGLVVWEARTGDEPPAAEYAFHSAA